MQKTRVTFRQTVEKTIEVDGDSIVEIYKQIEDYKENPEKIEFDKDFDSVAIEARVNL